MEFSSFSSPEFGNSSPEKKDSDDKESGKDKKKKSGSSATRLAGLATETSLGKSESKPESKPETPAEHTGGFEGLLQRLRGEHKPKEKEVPLFGIPKPENEPAAIEAAKAEPHETAKIDVGVEHEVEPEHETESDAETDTETETELTPEESQELRHAIQDYTEIRLEEVDNELHDMPLEQADSPEAAEVAAQGAYLRAIQERAADESDLSIDEALEDAGRIVTEHIEQPAEDYTYDEPVTQADGGGELPPPPPDDGESGNDDVYDGDDGGEGSGSGGGNDGGEGNGNGELPPEPPDMPRPPFWQDQQPQPFETFEPHAVPQQTPTPEAQPAPSHGNERAALGQGLLIGGVAGYFIGRHRGRKQGAAAAERRNEPVRKGLESRIRNLQEVITTKENQIKGLAREKMEALQGRKDRERFVNHVLQTPVERPVERPAVPEAKTVPTAVPARQESLRAAPVPISGPFRERLQAARQEQQTTPAPALAGEVYTRGGETPGKVLGEIPLAAAAGVAAVPAAVESLRREREQQPEPQALAEVIPFNKKAEEFNHEELMAAASKIKVEGTTLKEITELGRLDEPGLRRVVGEFLRGGDVSKVAAHEIKEKELRYEQDPRLRHHQDGQAGQAAAGALGAGGLIVSGLLGTGKPGSQAQTSSTDGTSTSSDRRPQLDPDTLRAIRNKQVATVTVTVLVIVAVIVITLLLT